MELTLDQALQKGVEAHKAGKLQEADRYYTAILKANPKHPDANHNMGVLAVGVGKVEAALPLFKTALEVNSSIAQYWISYIDALIKLDRIADAKAVFDQAKRQGAKGDGFDQIEKRLDPSASNGPKIQEPPSDQLQTLINLHTQGRYQKALNEASKLLKEFPDSVILYNISGASNQGLEKLGEAIQAYNKAISIKPDYGVYNNMGNAFQELGRLDKAVEAYTKAISIKPDYPDAYYNMGNTLKDQGKLEDAIKAYTKAISIKPDHPDAYNNIGTALKDQGKLDEAIQAFNKAISIKPDYAEAYYNFGNVLQEQGKLDRAIQAYNKALVIKPDYALVYNNMGVTLKDQGKLEEALAAYNKALLLMPHSAEAHNNFGNVLQEQGKLEEAIQAYNNALVIKPDYAEAWNSLYFPLQAIKFQKKPNQSLSRLYPKEINSTYSKIQRNILDYRLNRGQEDEGIHLKKAISSLSNANNSTIQNPKFNKKTQEKIQKSPDKMVALLHFGRSGTGLMHSLIDGHPEVSTLPSIYFSEYFDNSNWVELISDGWDGMIDHFIATYEVLFDASSPVPVETKSKKLIYNIGMKEGMATVGEQKNEVLKVDKVLFREELKRLMAAYDDLDAFLFFKLVHSAYNAAINDKNFKNLIFYHIHNPGVIAHLNFIRSAPETKWILMVREPLQSLESWINQDKKKNWYSIISNNILSMLFEIDNPIYNRQRSLGLRLEDIKRKPKKTIQALCKWMDIKEEDSLYEMTAQGKKWWGDPNSLDYSKDGMEPFGKTSINRKIGSIFSENDQFILHTLFYPFSMRFGYTKENEKQFKADLQKIRPMINEIFDFEKHIAEQMHMSCEKLKDSGSYLYLRSGLLERWNTLNQFGTYPTMINQLQIN